MIARLKGWLRKVRGPSGAPGARRSAASPDVEVAPPPSPAAGAMEVNAKTVIVGDQAQVNIFGDPHQRRLLLIGFGIVLLAVLAVGFGAFRYAQAQAAAQRQQATQVWEAAQAQAASQTAAAVQTQAAAVMDKELNIAVAGFAIQGSAPDAQLGQNIGKGIYERLDGELKKKDLLMTVEVWGPDRVGSINGEDASQRADAAEKLALKIKATIVVYGVIDVTHKPWKVAPEFYVSESNFFQSQEITGQYQLGLPIHVGSAVDSNFWVSLNKEIPGRVETLTWVTEGISAYAHQNYEQALELFQSAEGRLDEKDAQSLSVIYLLEGNAAINAQQYDLAEERYQKSLEKDKEYARAQIGMGSIFFHKALAPFNESKKPQDIDLALLGESEKWFQGALDSQNKPDQADIETKVHYNLGQCYFMRYYRGQKEYLAQSVGQFITITQEFTNNQNPRVKLWVGEAHARLGLIADNEGDNPAAISEYEKAVLMLDDYPERQALFQARLDKLRGTPSP